MRCDPVCTGEQRDPKILEMLISSQHRPQLLIFHHHQGPMGETGTGSQKHLPLPILSQHVSPAQVSLIPSPLSTVFFSKNDPSRCWWR